MFTLTANVRKLHPQNNIVAQFEKAVELGTNDCVITRINDIVELSSESEFSPEQVDAIINVLIGNDIFAFTSNFLF